MRSFAAGVLLVLGVSAAFATQSVVRAARVPPLTARETTSIQVADAVLVCTVLSHDEGAAGLVLEVEQHFKEDLGDTVEVTYPSYRLGTARPRGDEPIVHPTWSDVPAPRMWAAGARFVLLLGIVDSEDEPSYSVTGWFELRNGTVLGRSGGIKTSAERFLAGVKAVAEGNLAAPVGDE